MNEGKATKWNRYRKLIGREPTQEEFQSHLAKLVVERREQGRIAMQEWRSKKIARIGIDAYRAELNPKQKVMHHKRRLRRDGVVVKAWFKYSPEAKKAALKAANDKFVANNLEKVRATQREHARRRRPAMLAYQRMRRRTSPQFAAACRLRGLLRTAVKRSAAKKCASTFDLLGCSMEFFLQHIESKFTDGMNWPDFMLGKIHLDHIVPCAAFDLTDEEQQRKCFHWSNIQPLWCRDNLIKSSKLGGVRFWYKKKSEVTA